ncbi:MAG: 6-carboxytetrahydropterin synthase [Phycisphaerales bacterium]|nr:6-carboxytetrahydropterin synthase [Phycisphaerales bacterium]
MPTLSRTVRFCINPSGTGGAAGDRNGYAGVPAPRGLGRYYELTVTCGGDLDPRTGYLLNIKDIDRAARQSAIPIIEDACRGAPRTDPASLLPALHAALAPALPSLRTVRWAVTPYHSLEMSRDSVVLLRQRFDFAASHRLHVPSMTDAQNREAFGKCNHPGGHGHNYQVEPCVAVGPGAAFPLAELERLAMTHIVDRFDHKHLDQDTPDFARAGVTSTVENIARVCYDLLAPHVAAAGTSAALRSVTVWESDRTSSTYPG